MPAPAPSLGPVLRTLERRPFRRFVLVGMSTALLGAWLWQTLISQFLNPSDYDPADFHVYMGAAAALAHGANPYTAFLTSTAPDAAFTTGYVYPPLLAWLLQPVAGLQGPGLDLACLVVLQVTLVLAVALLLRALDVRSWEMRVLILALAVSWYPVRFDIGGQINMVIFALVVICFAGYLRGDRWWGGAALGVSIAFKLLTAPLLLLLAWRRSWAAILTAVATVAVLWLIAAPQFLLSYLLDVAPRVGAGTGFRENQTPTALISRLLDPASYLGQTHPLSWTVRLLALAVAVAVVLVTWRVIGRRQRLDRTGRALEFAAVLAAMPLCVALQTPSHYVTLLVSIAVLVVVAAARRDALVIWLVVATYVLTGPAHQAFLAAIQAGFGNRLALGAWAELSGVVPLTMLWAASLVALRRYGSVAGSRALTIERAASAPGRGPLSVELEPLG